jgi:hypothetical protein
MFSARSMRTTSSAAGGRPPALPDVNAETYPYDVVQHLLDQTANLLLYAAPDERYAEEATLTPQDPTDFFGLNGGYGLDLKSTMHRFRSTVRSPASRGCLEVVQTVGEAAGNFRSLWLFCPEDAAWAPGRYPPPALFDPYRSQRFVMQQAAFHFACTRDFCRGYGAGRTFPATADGRPLTLAAGIGTLLEGGGKFHGLQGTFSLTGIVTEELGFRGSITLRVVDPAAKIRSDRDVPRLKPYRFQPRDATFLVVRGEKRDRTVKTTFGPPPGDGRVSLVTPSLMRAVDPAWAVREGAGLHSTTRVGPPVGEFTATVYFDLAAPSGTVSAPVSFTTDEVYTFQDEDGNCLGTINAGVVEGWSFGLRFPSAPGQPGLRFGGVGPITSGTGQFAGAKGVLTVNSLIGISPHALSLLHTLHLVRCEAGPDSVAHPVEGAKGGERDPFDELMDRVEEHSHLIRKWRDQFSHCGERLAVAIAEAFGEHRETGEFLTARLITSELTAAWQQRCSSRPPFRTEILDRFAGAATGIFRWYERPSGVAVNSVVLRSVWDKTRATSRGYMQRITGSETVHIHPDRVTEHSSGAVDLTINVYREDLGITGWVSKCDRSREEWTAVAYDLGDRLLWVNKKMTEGGRPVEDDVFLLTLEWIGDVAGKRRVFMVGLPFRIDFSNCCASRFGNRFWKACYRPHDHDARKE